MYYLDSKLGEGSFGEVFHGMSASLDGPVVAERLRNRYLYWPGHGGESAEDDVQGPSPVAQRV